ncbi:unnamed protein product [Gongylonema pulchrum]|uniref:Folliculin domain-containing protein n=1 Tax=Gongylonema pulchrum TaxID=637853 RepID=A0A183E575_9BILA|nr:unnamed protein product [Gongylonema pulchrum]
MHAVLALCHFCENHGPRVLVTTQSMPENLRQSYSIPTDSAASTEFVLPSSCFFVDYFRRKTIANGWAYGQHSIFSRHFSLLIRVAVNDRVYELVKHACLHSLSCEVSMVSGSNSSKPSPSRSASASSSMEDAVKWEEPWVEADDGVILFGDDEHGYTLSSTFRFVLKCDFLLKFGS